MDTKHKIPPTYGAMWTKKPLYMEITVVRATVDQAVVGSTPIRHPKINALVKRAFFHQMFRRVTLYLVATVLA